MRKSLAALDLELGLKYYASSGEGIGGVIRRSYEDFIVVEISESGPVYPADFDYGEGEYTWFVLKKWKVDSITATKIIAKKLGVSHKLFSIAGLKDAKAETYQLVCVEGVSPDEVLAVKSKYFEVVAAFRRPFKLTPGMLYGNQFTIVVREVRGDNVRDRIDRITGELAEFGGAPNYYGYQRFGTIRPNTHVVGRYLVKRMFKEAFEEEVFRVYPNESPWAKEARIYARNTDDYTKAIEKFPPNLHHERELLRYLFRHPGDYLGAFRSLPLPVRRLFINAYQAYLFNKSLSARLERGLGIAEAYPGDLVALYDKSGYRLRRRGVIRTTDTNKEKVNELIRKGLAYLVLNVFGYGTQLARGEQGEIERKILREEGISLNNFKLKGLLGAESRGDLRRAALVPEDFEYLVNEDRSVLFRFKLLKGMYATVLLREYMKPRDILGAGF